MLNESLPSMLRSLSSETKLYASARLHRLEHVLGGDVEVRRYLKDRRRTLEALRQLVHGLVHPKRQLLESPRDLDGPPLVAEVPLQLADNRRRGIGGELDLAAGVEAVDGLDEADRADLDEVVDRLAAVTEPAREVLHQVRGTS